MKKLVFILIAVLSLSTPTVFAQSTVDPPKEEDPRPFFEFRFGRVSKDCGGLGICVFRINVTVKDIIQLVPLFLRPDGKIKVMFSAASYNANKAYFANNYLTIEEDFVIDQASTRAIGAADNYTIKKGKYPVTFDKSTNTYNCTF